MKAFPRAIKLLPQWAIAIPPSKAPRDAGGVMLSVARRDGWMRFDDAWRASLAHGGSPLGFVLTYGDPYAVIDLDTPRTADEAAAHQALIAQCKSYSELSISGRGVHIVGKGELEAGFRRGKVEAYSARRFIICTGNWLEWTPREPRDMQGVLTALTRDRSSAAQRAANVDAPAAAPDAQVRSALVDRASRNERLKRLLLGDWSGDYMSQSEADLAFLNSLCQLTRDDRQAARLFRDTPLGSREKAQRGRYVDRTISRARTLSQTHSPLALTTWSDS